jgi:predicted hydrocarbon binding protein
MNDEISDYEVRYSRAGEAYILRGLADEIINEFGEETARKIFYNTGKKLGEAFASKKGTGYDPMQALEILKKHSIRGDYYTIGILEGFVGKEGETVANIQIVNCVLQRIVGSEFTKRPILCKVTKGYIEGSLSKLTGLNVKEEVFRSEKDPFPTCYGRITFFKKVE